MLYNHCNFSAILGPAGSGKSTRIKDMCLLPESVNPTAVGDVPQTVPQVGEQMSLFESLDAPLSVSPEKKKLLLTATTGVAAFRLGEGCTTINSLFNFYDFESLQRNLYSDMWLSRVYDKLRLYNGVVVDEISMMRCDVLDMLVQSFLKLAVWRANDGLKAIDLIVSGDFLQIPPVTKNGEGVPYAFLGQWWPQTFAKDMEKLTRIWRQTDPYFQQSLAYARWGMGNDCALSLRAQNTRFIAEPVYGGYDGFSLYPVNASVDKHNRICLENLSTEGRSYVTERWAAPGHAEPPELQEIPVSQDFRTGCRVRITDNNHDAGYVNGRLGTLLDIGENPRVLLDGIDGSEPREIVFGRHVRLALRPVTSADNALVESALSVPARDFQEWKAEKIRKRELPFYDRYKDQIAYAAVRFLPLALGYASTYHKAQGLQFDRLQVDIRNRFAGSPQMVYVALSRCKTSQGLMIVGDSGQLAQRIVTSDQVKGFC